MSKLHTSGLKFSRLTVAGLVILACGTTVSLASGSSNPEPSRSAEKESASDAERPAVKVVSRPATVKVGPQAASAKAQVRRGVVQQQQSRIPQLSLRDPTMSPEEAMWLIQRRAEELMTKPHEKLQGYSGVIGAPTGAGGVDAPSSPPESGSGPTLRTFTNPGGTPFGSPPRNPGDWPPEDGPRMGEGINNCYTALMARNWPSDLRGFVDTTNLWQKIPLPPGAPDFDGDGEPDNPIPNDPVIIYFQILEESMTEIEWVQGEDNFNLIGLRGEPQDDPNNPGNQIPGELEETDGIADTWISDIGRLNLTIIPPPPDGQDVDPLLSEALLAMGLGPEPWGEERPAFEHPDAEAAYFLAQREYGGTPGFTFFDTFSTGQVPDEEEMVPVIFAALQAISEVCNVVFIRRSTGEFPGANFSAGYPFAPMGYTLDPSVSLLNPGAFSGGSPGDEPFVPLDDYPWILIVQGSPDRQGSDGRNFATRLGMDRGPGIPIGMQSVLPITADLNGDGFPDMVDLDGDGISDQIILSDFSRVFNPPGRTVLDADDDGAVTPLDTSITRSSPFPGSPGTVPLGRDVNGDGVADFILDPNLNGNDAVVEIFNLALDLGNPAAPGGVGDFVADNVTGSGPPSPPPVLIRPIPCELINISSVSVGVMVHEMMHHMGFMHEQQRPDRDDYVKINYENIETQYIGNFSLGRGGVDRYATYIDNFDTTNANGNWAVQGAPVDGGWELGDPSLVNAGLGDPPHDYAVDEDDESLLCYVTGNLPGQSLVGETILLSPTVYGPKGARVNFAYWLNSVGAGDLPEGDGLFVEISGDGGATWEEAWSVSETADEWRVAEIIITSEQASNTLSVRFIARGLNTDGVIVEAGIDRFRVLGAYDFESIMHYGPLAFSSNGQPTIQTQPAFAEFANRIGGRDGFTAGDRLSLQNLYGKIPPPDGHVGDFDPCRADVNEDGLFNAQDIIVYLEWYNSGDLRADFAQPEGVIDVFDLVQFFVEFQNSFLCLPSTPPNPIGRNNLINPNPQ